jgi:transposase
VSITFPMTCCPSTSSGFIRGVHGNEHRPIELERRRRRGARLLQSGIAQAEVARRVGVTHTSVSRWEKLRQDGGPEALRRPKRFGRPRRLGDAQCAQLIERLKAGALSAGFGTELWTLPRIRTLIMQRALRSR